MSRFTRLTGRLALMTACASTLLSPAFGLAQANEKKPSALNAALAKYGSKVELVLPADGGMDKRSFPEQSFDGDSHSRCVVWGLHYSYKIDLPAKTQIDRIAISHSDYKEQAAKDIRIELDDGTVINHTLELLRPVARKATWQEVPINKSVKKVTVTILSNFDEPELKVKYGGIGDIMLMTGEDLDQHLKVDFDPKQATFVHNADPENRAAATVTLPPRARKGEHPCLLMTPAELDTLRDTLQRTEKGKAALQKLYEIADGLLAQPVDFPDPKGPMAQVKSRGDDIAKRHDGLAKAAGTLGIAYAISKDPKYAKRTAEILVGYADRYASYPEHKGVNGSDTGKIMAQRLSEAMWLIPLIGGYDYIYNSDALTPSDRTKIENDLIRTCVEFIRRKEIEAEVADKDRKQANWRTEGPSGPKGKGAGNWVNFYAAATLMGGAVSGDQNMIDLGAAEFRMLLHSGIGEDGMWAEGAVGYQLFALRAMITGMETAARQGIDLYSYDNSRLKMMFDSSLRYAYPDGTAPGINDSSRAAISGWQTMVYDYGYLRFKDERYAPVINGSLRQLHISDSIYFPTQIYEPLPEPAAISYPSMVFTRVGFAVLRSDKRYELLKYGAHGGPHGHFDKLNFILFAGDELGGEPRFFPYENPLHTQWTKQTVSHNTMTVDERPQIAAEGIMQVFEDAGDIKVMRGTVPGAYPGVLLDRTIVSTNDVVLDLFRGTSQRDRVWDRTLRFNGPLDRINGALGGDPLGSGFGYQHIKVINRSPASDTWQGQWQTKVTKLTAQVAGQPGQEAIVGVGPDNDQMALIRQSGKTADFAMAYSTAEWGEVKNIKKLHDEAAGVSSMEAQTPSGQLTVFVAHRPGAWSTGGWSSDARVLCIRKDGAGRTTVLIGGGATAKGPAGEVTTPAAGNSLAKSEGATLKLVSEWKPEPTPAPVK